MTACGERRRRLRVVVLAAVVTWVLADFTVVGASGGGEARGAFERGRELVEEGRLRRGARALREAVALDQGFTDAWVLLAEVESRRGRPGSAIRAWRGVVRSAPTRAAALDALGVALACDGRARKAVVVLGRRAALGPPPSATTLAWLGVAEEGTGRADAARASYGRALALDGAEPVALARVGVGLVRAESREAGMGKLRAALGKLSGGAAELEVIGRAFAEAGDVETAHDLMSRAHAVAVGSDARARTAAELERLRQAIPRATSPANAPDIVLIVIDSLRADHLGCYGYARSTSPAIDELARAGVLFEQAVSQAPWTAASIASLLTGLYPSVHGVDGKITWRDDVPAGSALPFATEHTLPIGAATLPAVLRANGFATAGFVSHVDVNAVFGFGAGFDVYVDDHADYSDDVLEHKRRGDETLARASTFLAAPPPGPFFLFVHLNDPHWPYDPPQGYGRDWTAGYRGDLTPAGTGFVVETEGRPAPALARADVEYLVGLYDGEIAFADSVVRRLLSRLDGMKRPRPLITVITADHGEEFLDHGSTSHGYTLYEEQVHVPLIVRAPARLAPRRVRTPVELIDVMPTLLEAAGLSAAVPPEVQGTTLLGLARGGAIDGAPGETFSEAPLRGRLRALREARGTKLIVDDEANTSKLFDLSADPGEHDDLARRGDARVDGLGERMQQRSEANRATRERLLASRLSEARAPLDDATRRKLEALGYTGSPAK